MPVVIGFHPIYELPDGNRNDWTVSTDAKTHWIEIPQRLPTGETQPIEKFFGGDRRAIQLKNYALIDDVFTDLDRDANGRATVKLMYNGKELHEILGPKFKTVLMWSTPLGGGGGGGGRGGAQGRGRCGWCRWWSSRWPGRCRCRGCWWWPSRRPRRGWSSCRWPGPAAVRPVPGRSCARRSGCSSGRHAESRSGSPLRAGAATVRRIHRTRASSLLNRWWLSRTL